MIATLQKYAAGAAQALQLKAINAHIAQAMLGRMVSVQTNAHVPAHGVVAGVLLDTESPKLVINGSCYDLGQVLTVTPVCFN
jgi:hypothetical protein